MKPQVKALLKKNRCKNLEDLSKVLNISYASMKNRSCGKTLIDSSGKYKRVKIPKFVNEEIAELVGIILGDGHLNRKEARIVGNITEKEYYDYLKNLFSLVFGIEPILKCYTNSVRLAVNSVNISKYLVSLGLKLGDKIKNRASVPEWIFENSVFMRACLRGLFDTDGSFFPSSKGSEYNIMWKMGSNSLLPYDIRRLLIGLNFHPTRIFDNGRKVSLCRKNEIVIFFNEIDPKNNVQLLRYNNTINARSYPPI
jgi:hypothetical protein